MIVEVIDKTISLNQGLKISLEDNSRIIVRLSGTGTKGSTLRLYFEKYANKNQNLFLDPQKALSELITSLDNLLNIKGLTKMDKPTVIT